MTAPCEHRWESGGICALCRVSASEEIAALRARVERVERVEGVVDAARKWDGLGAVKVMHVLTCEDCIRLETAEGHWCAEAMKIGRSQIEAARGLKDALAALLPPTPATP